MILDMQKYLQLMRLNKPIGILLLLWPALWALWLANQGIPPLKLLVIFVVGTVLTRSAGCIINDICDRNFDQHVERTRTRPLASKQLSLTQAFILLFILAILAFILVLQLNFLTIVLSFFSAFIASIYPLMKRITHFPQVILGIAFSMSVPMAYSASLNHIPAHAYLLFSIAILWPIIYDTAYALTDRADDVKIGIKSTAIFWGNRSKIFIASLQVAFISGFSLLGWQEKLHVVFFVMLFLSALLFIYQQHLLKQDKPFAAFLNNQWVGALIFLGIFFSFSAR